MGDKAAKSKTAAAKAGKPHKRATSKTPSRARKAASHRATTKDTKARKPPSDHATSEYIEPDPPEAIERLYFLNAGRYVQHNGQGKMPEELARYIEANGGNYPSYIPLPMKAVEFCFGDWGERWGKVQWDGHGPLPVKVLRYVEENGVLPRYESA